VPTVLLMYGAGLPVGLLIAQQSTNARIDWLAPPIIGAYVAILIAVIAVVCLIAPDRESVPPSGESAFDPLGPMTPRIARREGAEPSLRIFAVSHSTRPDGTNKRMQAGPYLPDEPSGSLPLELDLSELIGKLAPEGSDWIWSAKDVALVNETNEYIRCRVHLIAGIDAENSQARDLARDPNDLVVIDPNGTAHLDMDFPLDWTGTTSQAGDPLELVFLEIGRSNREMRVPFRH
jgi:hypothetical protein